MVNLEWYRSFAATYQTGTVTAAAQMRFLTQPTLSQHIASLEQALGVQLFERTARRMLPTETARQLYPKVIASIERLEAIEHLPLQGASSPWLRLGAPLTYFMEYATERLSINTDLRLVVEFGETQALIGKLLQQDLDLVIATQKPSVPRLHCVRLEQEIFHIVAHPGVQAPDKSSPQAIEQWLMQQQWISYSHEMPIIRRYWQQVFHKRPEIEPRYIIPDLHAMLRAIACGCGVSILPDYLLRLPFNSVNLHIPWRPPVQVSNSILLVCLQERLREPHIAAALKLLDAANK